MNSNANKISFRYRGEMEGIEIYLNDQDNLNMAHIPNNVKDSFCFDLLMNDVDLAVSNKSTYQII